MYILINIRTALRVGKANYFYFTVSTHLLHACYTRITQLMYLPIYNGYKPSQTLQTGPLGTVVGEAGLVNQSQVLLTDSLRPGHHTGEQIKRSRYVQGAVFDYNPDQCLKQIDALQKRIKPVLTMLRTIWTVFSFLHADSSHPSPASQHQGRLHVSLFTQRSNGGPALDFLKMSRTVKHRKQIRCGGGNERNPILPPSGR